jgi:ferredoxin
LRPEQIEAGYVLLCVAYARSHCQFEVGLESQRDLYVNPFR